VILDEVGDLSEIDGYSHRRQLRDLAHRIFVGSF